MTKEQQSWMNRGAQVEREAEIAHMRRLLKLVSPLQKHIDWVLARHGRYDKRKGGLGK